MPTHRNPQIAFVHLFKCGGTSVIHRLRSMVGEDRFYHYRSLAEAEQLLQSDPAAFEQFMVIGGHMPLEFLDRNFPSIDKVTVLRNPIDRLISQYYHFRREYGELTDNSPPLVVQRARYCAANNFATYALSDDPEISRFTRNFMTRSLTPKGMQVNPDDPALLEDALATLFNFKLVTVSDRLDDKFFASVNALLVQGDIPPRKGLISRTLAKSAKNVSSERKYADISMTTEIMDGIMRRNWFDLQLYQRVKWFGL